MVFAPQGLQDSARRFNRDASLYGQYFRAKTTGRKGSRIGRINPRFCSPLATDNWQLFLSPFLLAPCRARRRNGEIPGVKKPYVFGTGFYGPKGQESLAPGFGRV